MMSIKKISLLALLAVTSVGGLASCNKESGESNSGGGALGNIVLSGPAEAQDFTLEKAEEWAEKNNLDYSFTYATHGEDKVDSEVTDWSASTAPDIYMFANDKTQPLVQANAITPVIDDNIEAMSDDYAISKTYLDTVTFNGNIYGYPYTLNSYCFWYNQDKVESYVAESDFATKTSVSELDYTKWTMDDWLKVAKAYDQDIDYPLIDAFYSGGAIATFGAGWKCTYNQNGQLQKVESDFSTNEAGYWAAENLRRWHEDYGGTLVDAQGTQQAPTNSSKVLATVNGAWALASSEGAGTTDYANEEIQCMPMPDMYFEEDNGTEHREPTKAFAGSKALGINPQKTGSDLQKAAALQSLALYLISPEVQEARYELNASWLPTSSDVVSQITDSKCATALNTVMSYSVPQANLPTNIWDAPKTLVTIFTEAEKNNTKTSADDLRKALAQMDSSLQNIAATK